MSDWLCGVWLNFDSRLEWRLGVTILRALGRPSISGLYFSKLIAIRSENDFVVITLSTCMSVTASDHCLCV